jgi:hypothetical protein
MVIRLELAIVAWVRPPPLVSQEPESVSRSLSSRSSGSEHRGGNKGTHLQIDPILMSMRIHSLHIFPDVPAESASECSFTDGAKERIAKIRTSFQTKTHILMERLTKTSTRRSVHIICTV